MTYKEIVLSHVQEYLKLKNWKHKKTGKLLMLNCIFCGGYSAQIIYGSYRIQCLNPNCSRKKPYSLISIVKKLEEDKAEWDKEKIIQYLKDLLKVNVVTACDEKGYETIFSFYEQNKFSLVPIVKNGKRPAEQGWTDKTHYDKKEWLNWIVDKGLNVGVRTGKVSNITVVDVDQKPIPKVIKDLLPENCLIQETKNGFHIFFLYEDCLPKTRIDELKIDIENNGGQVVIYPSITDDYKRKFLNSNPIIKMPNDLLEFIKSKIGVRDVKTASEKIKQDIEKDTFKKSLITQGEGRNDFLIRMAGLYRKELNIKQTEYVIRMLNKVICNPPLSYNEIRAMIGSVDKYSSFDKTELAHKILNYIKEIDYAGRKEIAVFSGENPERIAQVLNYLVKEGYLSKKGSAYFAIKKLEWKTDLINMGKRVNFKVPYFHDVAQFNYGDMILIGGLTKLGKTHISMNMVQRLVKQGIIPYYISLETGSRFTSIALELGLKEGDVKHAFCADPTTINLEDDAVTIIDWLLIKDKAKSDLVFQHFADQLDKTRGFLIIFMQLKDNNDWFAPNMVQQFPSLATKYIYTGNEQDEDYGTYGEWLIEGIIRESKSRRKFFKIPCMYNWETKELKRIDEIENEVNKTKPTLKYPPKVKNEITKIVEESLPLQIEALNDADIPPQLNKDIKESLNSGKPESVDKGESSPDLKEKVQKNLDKITPEATKAVEKFQVKRGRGRPKGSKNKK